MTRLPFCIATSETIPSFMKAVASMLARTLSPCLKLIFFSFESYSAPSKVLIRLSFILSSLSLMSAKLLSASFLFAIILELRSFSDAEIVSSVSLVSETKSSKSCLNSSTLSPTTSVMVFSSLAISSILSFFSCARPSATISCDWLNSFSFTKPTISFSVFLIVSVSCPLR